MFNWLYRQQKGGQGLTPPPAPPSSKAKPYLLHADMLNMALQLIPSFIEEDDGEMCFNLYKYMEELDARINNWLANTKCPVGKFEMSSGHIARYLWCCISLAECGNTYPYRFRGYPILD